MSKNIATELVTLIKEQESKFLELDTGNGNVLDFGQECLFARQQILKNEFTLKTAANNPQSLRAAILNVAAIGISLNPAQQHAYLVPRDKQICLDISFRGLVKLATDSGSIKWAKAELVYSNDKFEWNGPAEVPTHKADPFGDRGELKGGYVIAKLPDDSVLVDVMTVEEINKIRDTSKAYQRKSGPWIDWYEEMAKKTLIKRAYKSWPQTENRKRFDHAISVLNEHEGTAYTLEQQVHYMTLLNNGNGLEFYAFRHSIPERVWIALHNSFEKGHKVAGKAKANELERKGIDEFNACVADLISLCQSDDDHGVREILDELSPDALNLVMKSLPPEAQDYINAMMEKAA